MAVFAYASLTRPGARLGHTPDCQHTAEQKDQVDSLFNATSASIRKGELVAFRATVPRWLGMSRCKHAAERKRKGRDYSRQNNVSNAAELHKWKRRPMRYGDDTTVVPMPAWY
jgi:hypothetical protein